MEVGTIGMGTYGATWEAHGYCGTGDVAGLVDTLVGRPAIVCGGGRGVFEEIPKACRLLDVEWPVMFAANDVGMYLDRLDHWCSLHTENLEAWKAVRWLHHRGPEDARYHGIDTRPFIDYNWGSVTPLMWLSGYFAMQIAWIMGASPIVLCGCPGNPTPRFFETTPPHAYGGGDSHTQETIVRQLEDEMKRLPDFKAAVRSMSGATAELFGRP